jgi:hypothetical protein
VTLLGVVAYCTCFLASGGAHRADATGSFCCAPAAISRLAGEKAVHHHPATRITSPSRAQANDSGDDDQDGSAGNDLTASLDDDDYHAPALVWKRLIVNALATLVAGDQATTLDSSLADGVAAGDGLCLESTSLRSLNVCLQI